LALRLQLSDKLLVAIMFLVMAILLVAVLLWPLPASAQVADEADYRQEYVRVTFYVIRGPMASGIVTHKGSAACSSGFPMGTKLEFKDGWQVSCLDRGRLGAGTGWVDVWAESMAWGYRNVEGDYGRYAWVKVVCWGWCQE
jgi:hypothetical protein